MPYSFSFMSQHSLRKYTVPPPVVYIIKMDYSEQRHGLQGNDPVRGHL